MAIFCNLTENWVANICPHSRGASVENLNWRCWSSWCEHLCIVWWIYIYKNPVELYLNEEFIWVDAAAIKSCKIICFIKFSLSFLKVADDATQSQGDVSKKVKFQNILIGLSGWGSWMSCKLNQNINFCIALFSIWEVNNQLFTDFQRRVKFHCSQTTPHHRNRDLYQQQHCQCIQVTLFLKEKSRQSRNYQSNTT